MLGMQPMAAKFGADLFAEEGVSESDLFSDPPPTTGGSVPLVAAEEGAAAAPIEKRRSAAVVSAPRPTAVAVPAEATSADVDSLSQAEMLDELGVASNRRPLKIIGAVVGVGGLLFALAQLGVLSSQEAKSPAHPATEKTQETRVAKGMPPGEAGKGPSAPVPAATTPKSVTPELADSKGKAGIAPGDSGGKKTPSPPSASPSASPEAPVTAASTGQARPSSSASGEAAAVAAPLAAAVPAPVAAGAVEKPSSTAKPAADFALLRLGCRKAYEGQKYDEIMSACARAVEAKTDAADVMVMMAHAELDRGRPQEALSWAKKAVAVDPKLAEGYVFIGGAEQEAGRKREAKAAYKKYLELAPKGQYATDLRAIMSRL
jgi:hypothetical protein